MEIPAGPSKTEEEIKKERLERLNQERVRPIDKAQLARKTGDTKAKRKSFKKVLSMMLDYKVVDPELTGVDAEFIAMSEGFTYREVIAAKLITLATFGDLKAIKEVMDRVDGKPTAYTESKNVSMDYKDFLAEVERAEGQEFHNRQVELCKDLGLELS